MEGRREEFKVVIKLDQEGASFAAWNPIRLTKSICKKRGEVRCAKVLRNGTMLIVCKDGEQQTKAVRMSKVDGNKVQCSLMSNRRLVRGVRSNV